MTMLYWFLTDFVINFANLLNISYMEANGLIFGLLYPLYFSLMLAIGFWRRRVNQLKWNAIRKRKGNMWQKHNIIRPRRIETNESEQEKLPSTTEKSSAKKICEYCERELKWEVYVRLDGGGWICTRPKCSRHIIEFTRGIVGQTSICDYEKGNISYEVQSFGGRIYLRERDRGQELGKNPMVLAMKDVIALRDKLPKRFEYLLTAPKSGDPRNPNRFAWDGNNKRYMVVGAREYKLISWAAAFNGEAWFDVSESDIPKRIPYNLF